MSEEQYEEEYDEQELVEHDDHHSTFYEDMMHHEKITFQDVKEHIAGPIISLVFHIILVAILWNVVVFQPAQERSEIEVQAKELEVKELEDVPDPPEPEELDVKVEVEIDIESPAMDNQPVEVDMEVSDMSVEDPISMEMPEVLVQDSSSALKVNLPSMYSNRSAAGIKSSAKKFGGRRGVRTLKSVDKSLKWLAAVQNEDGSWGTKYKPALTGMVTLALLAHGETPQSAEYGQTVLKAFKFLCSLSGKRYGSYAYSNGIVTYAISEGYGLTKIPALKKAMDAGITTIVNGLNKYGSINYGYSNKPQVAKKDPKTGKITNKAQVGLPRSDLSVAGWNYQALKAAFAAGCDVKGLEEAIDRVVNVGLKNTHYCKKHGGFSYSGGPKGGTYPSATMTSVGTLCLQLLGAGKSSQAKKGLAWIEKRNNGKMLECNWKKKPSAWSLYLWYYQTQAIFQGNSGKGKAWKTWNKSFTKALLREQNPEGWWKSPFEKYGVKKDGHGHTETAHLFGSELDIKVYSTALCTLMLEVYYRYLPTFKVSKHGSASGKSSFSDDDLNLSIE